ncbi:unnamed protein product [Protopolystoma xenopodis]|uniref:Uncharacterized protein n=1 Tax=Protopolystoma xenopodis TaxID=117903 RepID=A0A448WD15_9PLAT|nr:unnamed protein product [Protopolystoma xenopodis]
MLTYARYCLLLISLVQPVYPEQIMGVFLWSFTAFNVFLLNSAIMPSFSHGFDYPSPQPCDLQAPKWHSEDFIRLHASRNEIHAHLACGLLRNRPLVGHKTTADTVSYSSGLGKEMPEPDLLLAKPLIHDLFYLLRPVQNQAHSFFLTPVFLKADSLQDVQNNSVRLSFLRLALNLGKIWRRRCLRRLHASKSLPHGSQEKVKLEVPIRSRPLSASEPDGGVLFSRHSLNTVMPVSSSISTSGSLSAVSTLCESSFSPSMISTEAQRIPSLAASGSPINYDQCLSDGRGAGETGSGALTGDTDSENNLQMAERALASVQSAIQCLGVEVCLTKHGLLSLSGVQSCSIPDGHSGKTNCGPSASIGTALINLINSGILSRRVPTPYS